MRTLAPKATLFSSGKDQSSVRPKQERHALEIENLFQAAIQGSMGGWLPMPYVQMKTRKLINAHRAVAQNERRGESSSLVLPKGPSN